MHLNTSFSLRDLGLSNGEHAEELPRHRWYGVKEAFSPQLVQMAIADHKRTAAVVVDPFSGSGTVVVESASAGATAAAIEVNPFLTFLGRTKLSTSSVSSVMRIASCAFEAAFRGKKASPLNDFSTFGEGGAADKWLFNVDVLEAFESGWSAIAGDGEAAMIVKLALLRAAMESCNAVRDGKCLRYRTDWREAARSRHTFLEAFEEQVRVCCDDLTLSAVPGKAKIIQGDARRAIGRLPEFDLCVTSPPYLNSFDYTDVYRPELFLGQFIGDMRALRALRQKTLRSHVQASWPDPLEADFGPLYEQTIAELTTKKLWSRRLPQMIQAYFEDMKTVLSGLHRRAKEGASLWLVVSTSAYAGVEVPVDLITAHVGGIAGWKLREVGVLRRLRSSGQHWNRSAISLPPLRESIVIWDV
jgi:hypothetical protein